MWAATGGGLRGHGWAADDFLGVRLPRIAGSSQAEAIEACARAALGGECTELEMNGMPERVEAVNGRFRAITAPGEGTVIEAKLPLNDPPERWKP
jgi:hypothetical protein